MKFRQGFGRLIRTSTDRGAVICLDSRVLKNQAELRGAIRGRLIGGKRSIRGMRGLAKILPFVVARRRAILHLFIDG